MTCGNRQEVTLNGAWRMVQSKVRYTVRKYVSEHSLPSSPVSDIEHGKHAKKMLSRGANMSSDQVPRAYSGSRRCKYEQHS